MKALEYTRDIIVARMANSTIQTTAAEDFKNEGENINE